MIFRVYLIFFLHRYAHTPFQCLLLCYKKFVLYIQVLLRSAFQQLKPQKSCSAFNVVLIS